jgi:hypothetical protein
LNYLLFFGYLPLICWMLMKLPFVKNSGLGIRVLLLLFLCKLAAGIAIGWMSLHLYQGGNDYWDLNREGWKEYQLLLANPGEYFSNLFRSDYAHGYSGFFDSFQSYWNDLRNNLIIKLVSLFNIFSRGDYYINSLFFNALVFLGHVALYRLFVLVFQGKKVLIILGCFLLPSTLYFTSGIHRDGIVFLLLAGLIYVFYVSLLRGRFGWKHWFLLGCSSMLLLLLRSYVMLALLPALFAWGISVRWKRPALRVFIILYGLSGILFFVMPVFSPSINPMGLLVQKQADYLQLPPSATAIPLRPLSSSGESLLVNMPQALNHVFLRPYVWELPSRILLPMNLEWLCYELLFLAFLFYRIRIASDNSRHFLVFSIFFVFSLFLFIGYIVPNLGTLLRYRSLYLPLIITPLLVLTDWLKLGRVFKIIK